MGDIFSALAVIGVLVLIIVWAQIAVSRRNLVLNSSSALGGLARLNSAFAPVFSSYPRVHFDYNTRVNSKAKFDRYDLQAFMRTCLLESESQVASCIDTRLQAEVKYATTSGATTSLADRAWGARALIDSMMPSTAASSRSYMPSDSCGIRSQQP